MEILAKPKYALLIVKKMKKFVLEDYCQMVAHYLGIVSLRFILHQDVPFLVDHHPVLHLPKAVLVDLILTLRQGMITMNVKAQDLMVIALPL